MPVMQSKQVEALENVFDMLNERYFESALSMPVITVAPTPSKGNGKILGHCTNKPVWRTKGSEACYYEINLNAETLNNAPIEIVETLVHEMVHLYCSQHNIKDTSRNGTYHNENFKRVAETHGLIVTKHPSRGWQNTEPSKDLEEFVSTAAFQKCIDAFSRIPMTIQGKKPSSTRKYICPKCHASVRATRDVNISCLDCNIKMVLA